MATCSASACFALRKCSAYIKADGKPSCALQCEPSTRCAIDRCRCSCTVAFGSWEPLELHSLLELPECSCVAAISAAIRLFSKEDLRSETGVLARSNRRKPCNCNAEHHGCSSMTYDEWTSQPRPIRLPPGLPRPPRPQPEPAGLSASPLAYDEHDGGLEDDCNEWYSRNVSCGNFFDWLREATNTITSASTSADNDDTSQLQQQPQTTVMAAAAASSASVARGCSDADLDDECDEWFNRHVASGLFASWHTSEGTGISTTATSASISDPGSLQQQPAGRRTCDGAAEALTAADGVTKAMAVSYSVKGRVLPHIGILTKAAAAATAAATGAADDDDVDGACDSLPPSPTESDYRAASEGCSRRSSRSCSSLSLLFSDEDVEDSACGSCISSSGSGEDEAAAAAGEEEEKREQGVWLRGLGQHRGCRDACCTAGGGGSNAPDCCAKDEPAGASLVAAVRLVDCSGWERELEPGAVPGACAAGAGSGSGAVATAAAGVTAVGLGEENEDGSAPYHDDSDVGGLPEGLLAAVVEAALFA